jgi:hypothetical protein
MAEKGYDRYCGPAVVSAVLDISRDDAAARLKAIERKNRTRNRASTRIDSLVHVFERAGLKSDTVCVRSTTYEYDLHGFQRVKSLAPTVARYIAEHRTGTYVLLASHHYVAVHNGEVIEDNGRTPWRAPVGWVITAEGATPRKSERQRVDELFGSDTLSLQIPVKQRTIILLGVRTGQEHIGFSLVRLRTADRMWSRRAIADATKLTEAKIWRIEQGRARDDEMIVVAHFLQSIGRWT